MPTWLRRYRFADLPHDVVAALVVAMLLVPQSLGYAMLAGLPPHVGLYASVLPLIAYAALGSSMTLSVGPVAVVSLMTAAAISPLAAPGSIEYARLAVTLALLGGLMLLAMGLLRMGFLANLLSHSVISGFVTGSALLIALGQLGPLLGVTLRGDSLPSLIASTLQAEGVHRPTAALGLASLALLWSARRHLPDLLSSLGLARPPAELLARLAPMAVVLLAVAAVTLLSLDARGVTVVGEIPRGLPTLQLSLPGVAELGALTLPAFTIALVGFVESVSVAQSFALKRGERIDANAELRGLGAANLASGLSGGFPVAGGFARSGVNFAAGARTPLAGAFAAAAMALVLLGLTGLFERLALTVLAATILLAVLPLVDLTTPKRAWRYDRADAVAWSGTLAGVLLLGVEAGIGIGVALSLSVFLWRASRPHMAVLGRVPGSEHFRNELRFQVETLPGVLMLRVDENLFFANVAAVLDRVQQELSARPGCRHLVLVLSSVSHIDLTAAEALQRLDGELRGHGVALHLAEVKGPVLDRLRRSDWLQRLPEPPFVSSHEAALTLGRTGAEPGGPSSNQGKSRSHI